MLIPRKSTPEGILNSVQLTKNRLVFRLQVVVLTFRLRLTRVWMKLTPMWLTQPMTNTTMNSGRMRCPIPETVDLSIELALLRTLDRVAPIRALFIDHPHVGRNRAPCADRYYIIRPPRRVRSPLNETVSSRQTFTFEVGPSNGRSSAPTVPRGAPLHKSIAAPEGSLMMLAS